jgi:hypothetical protein
MCIISMLEDIVDENFRWPEEEHGSERSNPDQEGLWKGPLYGVEQKPVCMENAFNRIFMGRPERIASGIDQSMYCAWTFDPQKSGRIFACRWIDTARNLFPEETRSDGFSASSWAPLVPTTLDGDKGIATYMKYAGIPPGNFRPESVYNDLKKIQNEHTDCPALLLGSDHLDTTAPFGFVLSMCLDPVETSVTDDSCLAASFRHVGENPFMVILQTTLSDYLNGNENDRKDFIKGDQSRKRQDQLYETVKTLSAITLKTYESFYTDENKPKKTAVTTLASMCYYDMPMMKLLTRPFGNCDPVSFSTWVGENDIPSLYPIPWGTLYDFMMHSAVHTPSKAQKLIVQHFFPPVYTEGVPSFYNPEECAAWVYRCQQQRSKALIAKWSSFARRPENLNKESIYL